MGWFSRWRRARILRQTTLDPALWRAIVGRYAYTRVLSAVELSRLNELVALFLHEKSIHGAAGMVVREDVRLAIAVQACILILNLDLDYFRGWVEVIVYPDKFMAEYEYVDEAGVAHRVAEPMTGEAWARGPVILSWADAAAAGSGTGDLGNSARGARNSAGVADQSARVTGYTTAGATAYNVVIHEFAHKLDMLNGEPNGFPPLHAGMSRTRWADAFTAAYADFCDRIDSGIEVDIDEYAAESPAEFFAVMSEVFFESPLVALESYPDVYAQLAAFYRQDPAARSGAGERALERQAIA